MGVDHDNDEGKVSAKSARKRLETPPDHSKLRRTLLCESNQDGDSLMARYCT